MQKLCRAAQARQPSTMRHDHNPGSMVSSRPSWILMAMEPIGDGPVLDRDEKAEAREPAAMNATVLIATYNRARILGDAIEAVLTQRTSRDFQWELLIVDNNSRDDTRAVVERYADVSLVPVRYLFESRQGKSHALNAGLGHARGAIVAFTDDDVIVPPDWLSTATSVLDRWGADGCGGRVLPKWETAPPSWLASNPRLRGHLALMEVETQQMLQYPLRGPGNIW